jgi:hypothetical protein
MKFALIVLLLHLFAAPVEAQSAGDPKLILFQIPPNVTIVPPVSNLTLIDGSLIILSRVQEKTDVLVTMNFTDGSTQRAMMTLSACFCAPGEWHYIGVIGVGRRTLSSASWAILTAGPSQVVAVGK